MRYLACDDPIEAVAFFMNTEQLFDVYKVPTDLKALLIRPYLNDKAKNIVSKFTPDVAGDYSRLKDASLHKFKLSSNTYLERFNSCRKSGAETFVAFASRLKGLLNYYLDSSYVTDFAKLCELLMCEHIKSTLSGSCLQYVLSIESGTKDGWMPIEKLTSSIDRYQSAHSAAGVARAFAIGAPARPVRPQTFGVRPQSYGARPQ